MYRVAFDPSLPVVAASPFTAAGRSFAAGDEVDWRKLGVDEMTLRDWWRAMLVVHPLPDETPVITIDESTAGQKRTFVIDGKPVELTSGPTFHVETPAQRRTRKRKPDPVDSLSDDELERLTRPE